MKIGYDFLKKICAVTTALCFCATMTAENIYAVAQTKTADDFFFANEPLQKKSIVPAELGKVTSFNNNNSGTIVIHIQDLHCDYDVQKKISGLIESLSKQYCVQNVYLEGGYSNLDISLFTAIKPVYKNKILDSLLKEGRLTAAEYYAVMNSKQDLLKGIENKQIHLHNLERLLNILNDKQENLQYLSKISKEIDFLKAKYLGYDNKKFNAVIEKYERGKISQEKYFRYLLSYAAKAKIKKDKFENLSSYLQLHDENGLVDFEKAKKEFKDIALRIKNGVSYDSYNKFLNITDNFSNTETLNTAFEEFCEFKGISFEKKYSNLHNFLHLKADLTAVNPVKLVEEERYLIDYIRAFLSIDSADMEVSYISDFEKYFRAYLTADLTAWQWKYFQAAADRFKDLYAKYSVSDDVSLLESRFKQIDEFYAANTERDRIFVDNMKLENSNPVSCGKIKQTPGQMLSNANNIVVLLAGGFHSEGIIQILNEKNISNITITPNIKKNSKDSRINYEFLLSGQAGVQNQTIALSLISNASKQEQASQIVKSLMLNQNFESTDLKTLANQLNMIFEKDIKVQYLEQENKLEFVFADAAAIKIDITEDIAAIVKKERISEIPPFKLSQITDQNLKDISELVLKTTFNAGMEIFAPKIFSISKDICVFMVNNKWYLGNGAVWDIANSKYSGQILDGVEPVIYEYMPEPMQKALLQKTQKTRTVNKSFLKIVRTITKKLTVFILITAFAVSSAACGLSKAETNYPAQQQTEIYSPSATLQNENFIPSDEPSQSETYGQTQTQTQPKYVPKLIEPNAGQEEKISFIKKILGTFEVSKGVYRSFIYSFMSDENKAQLSNNEKYTLFNLENLYDQSLAALTFLKIGEVKKAEEILLQINNKLILYRSNLEPSHVTGEIVWVGIAAVQYKLLTGSDNFDNMITRVDNYLESAKGKTEGSYYGETGKTWISTEHMLDIIAFYNLITLYDSSEYFRQKLESACKYTYEKLYRQDEQRLRRGEGDSFPATDVSAWGVQVFLALKEINPDIYESSGISNIDLDKILQFEEKTSKVSIEYEGIHYDNLYRWSDTEECPVSFEPTRAMAVAYNTKGQHSIAYAIEQDVVNYSKALGSGDFVFYADQNQVLNYPYSGWLVYMVPALSTSVGQYAQLHFGSYFFPMAKIKGRDYTASPDIDKDKIHSVEAVYAPFNIYEDTYWRTYAMMKGYFDFTNMKEVIVHLSLVSDVKDGKVKFQLLPRGLSGRTIGFYDKEYSFDDNGNMTAVISMEEFLNSSYKNGSQLTKQELREKHEMNIEEIQFLILAGQTVFYSGFQDFNEKNLDIKIHQVDFVYKDGTKTTFSTDSSDNIRREYSDDAGMSVSGSILPETLDSLNNLITAGMSNISYLLKEILRKETLMSLVKPFGFISKHKKYAGASLVVLSGVLFFSIGILTAGFSILSILASLSAAVLFNMATHAAVDFIYLKSSQLEEALRLYGGQNVRLADSGINISDEHKPVPVCVINDKPGNYSQFDFKPIAVKFKSVDGKKVRGWLGRYKGTAVVFAQGADYEDIVNVFSKTKQFRNKKIKADVEIIEIDFNNPERQLEYSESGNVLIGLNEIQTKDSIDRKKVASLLYNSTIDAVTVNRNSAIQVDVLDGLATYADLKNFISEAKTADTRLIFSEEEFNEIMQLIRGELSRDSDSKDLEELVAARFLELTKDAADTRNNLRVTIRYLSSGDTSYEKETKYAAYGITSFVFDSRLGSKYYDKISGFTSDIKEISDLNDIQADGFLYVFKLSRVVKEIEESSLIFTFLKSVNINQILKQKNVNFVTQAARNFGFDQFPELSASDRNDIIDMLRKAEDITDYGSVLDTFFTDISSVVIYFRSLENPQLKNAFAKSVLERMLLVGYLRDNGITKGFVNKSYEELLTNMLLKKYLNSIIADTEADILTLDELSSGVKAENLTVLERQKRLDKKIYEMLPAARSGLSKEQQFFAINGIIKLLTLYADNDVNEEISVNANVINIANFKAILAAA